MDDILKQKQERFKNLGIPIPIEKPNFDQPVVNVKDPQMLKRIQEIKNGAKKGEFNELLSAGNKNAFQAIPENKKRPNNKISESNSSKPKIENSNISNGVSTELDIMDKLFSGEVSTPPISRNGNSTRLNEEINTDSNGSEFLNNFRQKLQAKAMSNSTANNQQNSTFGFKNQNESSILDINKIENKIYEISSKVAKQISEETIKEILDRYLSKKGNIQENTIQKNTFEKTLKDDIIKIGDRYFKLTPVKIKSK